MTLTKAHLVDRLFAKNIFTKTESAHIIETLVEIIKQSLEDGDVENKMKSKWLIWLNGLSIGLHSSIYANRSRYTLYRRSDSTTGKLC